MAGKAYKYLSVEEIEMNKKNFGLWMNFNLSVVNGITVSTVMTLVNVGPVLKVILISILQAILISFVLGLIFPGAKLGGKLAARWESKKMPYLLLSSLPTVIVMVAVLTAFFTYNAVGFSNIFIPAFFSGYPIGFVVSYLTTIIFTPLSEKLCISILK